VVCKTRDTKLDRTVALKFLPKHLLCGKAAARRFSNETRTTSVLDHPVTTIHEMVQSECSVHTEHVEGKPIKQLLFVRDTSLTDRRCPWR